MAWRGDGQELAFWTTTGALGVVQARDVDSGSTAPSTLLLEQPGLVAAAYAGETLIVRSRRERTRTSRVRVASAGADAALDVQVDLLPEGAQRGTSIFGPPHSQPAPTTESPPPTTATEPAPPPAATTTPPPPAEETPPPAAPIPPALAHVHAGQLYTFTAPSGLVKTWEVLEVHATEVVYRETITLNGQTVGEPGRQTWALRRFHPVVEGTRASTSLAVGGISFPCAVLSVGSTTTTTAVTDDGWLMFPGEVEYVRGRTRMWSLTGIEDPR
jgi:hypothetical protein